MSFFFGKKNNDKNCSRSLTANHNIETAAQSEVLKSHSGIKVLGSGCAKCRALEDAVRAAMLELGIEEEVEHVTDFIEIASYGVMTTPALVVNGKVLSYGKVLLKDEAKALIAKAKSQ